ncbi:MAG: hypothetical protein WCK09_00990 [Bacteroidota bacterium]
MMAAIGVVRRTMPPAAITCTFAVTTSVPRLTTTSRSASRFGA